MRNGILERTDIAIDPDLFVSFDGTEIEAYVETWFDVDARFGTNTRDLEDTWLNLYASFNPFEDTLHMEYVVNSPDKSEGSEFVPSNDEASLIKAMIAEKIRELFGMTPEEFCTTQ